MAGYLDAYGAGDERRSRRLRWLVLSAILLLFTGTLLYFAFRDRGERNRVKAFLGHLRSAEYQAAYALWGCTEANPCRDYAFDKFMEDWGPKSVHANAAAAELGETKSCETGIIQFVKFPGPNDDVQLWVERGSRVIGFAPWRLRELPTDSMSRFRATLWNLARDCNPLLAN